MDLNIDLKLEYWIIDRRTGAHVDRRTIPIDEDLVLDGARDELSSPISYNMEDDYRYGSFRIISE